MYIDLVFYFYNYVIKCVFGLALATVKGEISSVCLWLMIKGYARLDKL